MTNFSPTAVSRCLFAWQKSLVKSTLCESKCTHLLSVTNLLQRSPNCILFSLNKQNSIQCTLAPTSQPKVLCNRWTLSWLEHSTQSRFLFLFDWKCFEFFFHSSDNWFFDTIHKLKQEWFHDSSLLMSTTNWKSKCSDGKKYYWCRSDMIVQIRRIKLTKSANVHMTKK
jgi:hypothetical protein